MASQAASAPSALAGTLGEMIGEFFGTMVLILFGDGCVVEGTNQDSLARKKLKEAFIVDIELKTLGGTVQIRPIDKERKLFLRVEQHQ